MERGAARRCFGRILRVIAKGIASLVVLAMACLLWLWYLNRPPHYPVTLPAVPANNALDNFSRASRMIRFDTELFSARVDWQTSTVRAFDENMLKEQRAENAKYGIHEGGELARVNTQLTLPALLAANQPALQQIRQGLQYAYVIPLVPRHRPAKSSPWLDSTDDDFFRCRQLLEVNALYLLSTSDTRAAANALLDLRQFGVLTRRGANGGMQLQSLTSALSAQDARFVTARLEQINRSRPSYADYLAHLKPYVLHGIVASLSDPNRWRWNTNRWAFALPQMHPSSLDDRSLLVNEFYAWTVPNAWVPGITDRYMTTCIRLARQPFNPHTVYPSPPRDPVNWQCFGWDEPLKEQSRWLLGEFAQDGYMLSVALHGYRLTHQQYPKTLEELVSDGWVKQLPVDPYCQQETLCYRSTGAAYAIYSRGPDGKDDGGQPVGSKARPLPGALPVYQHDREYYIRVDSKGDLIYGMKMRGEDNLSWGRL